MTILKTFTINKETYTLIKDNEDIRIHTPENCFGYVDVIRLYNSGLNDNNKVAISAHRKHTKKIMTKCEQVLKKYTI